MIDQTLVFPDSFHRIVGGRLSAPGVELELHHYRWDEPQEALFKAGAGFLDLALSGRAPEAEGVYIDAAPAARRRMGEMIFIPADYALQTRWAPCEQRSICCTIDIAAMAGGDALDWSEPVLAESLDVRNLFIREALLRLAIEAAQPGFASGLLVESLCAAIAIDLHRHFHAMPADAGAAHGRLDGWQLHRIEEMIADAPGGSPGLAALARECGVSVRHFSRLFRNTTGQTLGDYAARLRVERAKALLAESRLLIKEVAFRCGFESAAAFSAAFRRMVGVTPRQFRRGAAPIGRSLAA